MNKSNLRPLTLKIFTSVPLAPALIFGVLICYGLPSAQAEEWPIIFTDLRLTSAPAKGPEFRDVSYDCQPELFDPRKARYHSSGSGNEYALDGPDANEAVSMEIFDGIEQNGKRIQLPVPYSLVQYNFSCMSEGSSVIEVKENKARHALYTHVSSMAFSPDLKRMAIWNALENGGGKWEEHRRIIDIQTKDAATLPFLDATSFIADMNNQYLVTYGGPLPAADFNQQHRIAAIWDNNGHLVRALFAPIKTTDANAENSFDGIGLLPAEPSTFYHLTRTGKDKCTLRLQDIHRQNRHRTIQLRVPGAATDQTNVGMRVQLDLREATLKGGAVRYRVAPSGRGDVDGKWGAWQTAE